MRKEYNSTQFVRLLSLLLTQAWPDLKFKLPVMYGDYAIENGEKGLGWAWARTKLQNHII